MIVQFNLAAAKLAALVRERLLGQPICAPYEFLDHKGRPALLDHVALGSGEFRRVKAPATINLPTSDPAFSLSGGLEPVSLAAASRVEISQPLLLSIATLAELKLRNAEPAKDFLAPLSPQINLLLDFAVDLPLVAPRVPKICVSYRGLEMGPLEAILGLAKAAELRTTLEGKIKSTCTPFPLGPLTALLGEGVDVVNAGAAYDEALGIVAIRLETRDLRPSPISPIHAWERFYAGQIGDGLHGRASILADKDWSLFVDRGLVLRGTERQVNAAIASAQAGGRFTLTDGPHLGWSNSGGAASVTATFEGEVVDACTCGVPPFSWEVDVDVSVTATVTLDVPATNKLRTTIAFDWDSDNWDLSCCHLSAALSWITIGAKWVDKGEVDWNQYALGLELGPLAVFIASIYAASKVDIGDFGIDTSKLKGTCEERPKENQIVCLQPVAYPESSVYGALTLLRADGLDSGLLLSGAIGFGETKPATLKVAGPSETFAWDWDDQCARTGLVARGSFALVNAGEAPFSVCRIEETGAHSEQFAPYRTLTPSSGSTLVEYTVPREAIGAAYLADPGPLVVTVHTNGGARILTLPAIAMMTDAEIAEFTAVAKIRPDFCYPNEDDPFMRGIEWTTRWIPGPGPDPGDGEIDRIWQVLIGGLDPGDEVEVRDGARDLVAIMVANLDGTAQVAVMSPPGVASDALSLRRLMTGSTEGNARSGWLGQTAPFTIRQTSVYPLSVAPLGTPGSSLALGHRAGREVLFAVTEAAIEVHDLSIPERPTLAAEIPGRGFQEIVRLERHMIAWGEGGLGRLSESLNGGVELLDQSAIRGVSVGNGRLFVLTGDEVRVFDRELQPVGRFEAEGARRLLGTATTLVLAGEHDLRLFDLADPTRPRLASEYPLERVTALTRDRTIEGRGAVYARTDQNGGVVLDVSTPSEPRELGRYPRDPRFPATIRTTGIMVRLSEDGRSALVLAAGRRTVI